MKRDDNIFNYGHAVRQKAIINGLVEASVDEKRLEKVRAPRSEDSFISIVYALDPMTKLPTGDLSYLVSDKANPEIKNWVLQNIMLDCSGAAAPAAPAGLSDDDIAALARDPRETSQDYMNRVNDYAQSNKSLYERLASMSKQSNGESGEFVSSQSKSSSVPSE